MSLWNDTFKLLQIPYNSQKVISLNCIRVPSHGVKWDNEQKKLKRV